MLKKNICIIDPLKEILDVFRMILEEKGYEVDTALDLEQAFANCSLKRYAVIISEYFAPRERMQHFIRTLKKLTPDSYHIMSTSVIIDDEIYKELFDMGLDDLLVKPYSREKLLAHIEKGMKRQGLSPGPQESVEDSLGIFNPNYFTRFIRQELKRSRRHQQPFSLILLKLPFKNLEGVGHAPFYFGLANLLRKSLREEDLLGRQNGGLGVLLPQTDQKGSRVVGKRLSTLIQSLPAFQTRPSSQPLSHELTFQYYTFPDQSGIPKFLSTLFEEIYKEFPSS